MKTKEENFPKFWDEKNGNICVIEGYNQITFSLKDLTKTYVVQKRGTYHDQFNLGKYFIVIDITNGKLTYYAISEK